MIGRGQAFEARPQRWLAKDQTHPRCHGHPAVARGVIPQHVLPGRARKAQHRGGGPFPEAAQVLTEAGLDRPHGSTIQALDKPPDKAEGVLEGEPRIALEELPAGCQLDVTRADTKRGSSARLSREAARGKDRVEQCEAQRCQHWCCPKVALDPLQDGRQADQLAGCMEVQQLVGKGRRPWDVGESGAKDRAGSVHTDIGGGAALVVGIERGLSMLLAAALVATDRTAVVPGDRASEPSGACVLIDRPGDLIGHQRA